MANFREFRTEDDLKAYIAEQVVEENRRLPLPSKKPDRFKFNSTSTSFRDYLTSWDNYAAVVKIPKASRLAVVRTFLDNESQVLVNGLNITAEQGTRWDEIKPRLIAALDKYTSKASLKNTFLRSVQQETESVTEYGNRLLKAYNKAFNNNEQDDLLCTVFSNGLKNDVIAFQLSTNEPATVPDERKFTALLRRAQELESAIASRASVQTAGLTSQMDVLAISDILHPASQRSSRHIDQHRNNDRAGYNASYEYEPQW